MSVNSYDQLRARQQKEVDDFPMAFAFNDKQFAEGMRKLGLDPSETCQVLSIGAGGFIRKTDEDAFIWKPSWSTPLAFKTATAGPRHWRRTSPQNTTGICTTRKKLFRRTVSICRT